MAVVPLRGTDVRVSQLTLHVHQRVSGRKPRSSRSVPQRVKRHVAERGIFECLLMPVARHGVAVQWATGAGTLPPTVAALGSPYRHNEEVTGGAITGRELAAGAQVLAQDGG